MNPNIIVCSHEISSSFRTSHMFPLRKTSSMQLAPSMAANSECTTHHSKAENHIFLCYNSYPWKNRHPSTKFVKSTVEDGYIVTISVKECLCIKGMLLLTYCWISYGCYFQLVQQKIDFIALVLFSSKAAFCTNISQMTSRLYRKRLAEVSMGCPWCLFSDNI